MAIYCFEDVGTGAIRIRSGMRVRTNGDGSKIGPIVTGRVLCVHEDRLYIEGNYGSACPQHYPNHPGGKTYSNQSFKIKFSSPGWIEILENNSSTVGGGNQKKESMNPLVRFVKNLLLTDDDKLLIELGIEDPTKVPTCDGLALSAQITYAKNRAEIIEHAKDLKAEQDKEKSK